MTSIKIVAELAQEYGLAKSTVRKWVNDYANSGSFKAIDNRSELENEIVRIFNDRGDLEILVSDLTYVQVGNAWYYIYLITNLYNRAVVGFATGEHKTAELAYKAFMNSNINLSRVGIFHTDRGSEFKNFQIDELLYAFNIKRSLSRKCYLCDTYK